MNTPVIDELYKKSIAWQKRQAHPLAHPTKVSIPLHQAKQLNAEMEWLMSDRPRMIAEKEVDGSTHKQIWGMVVYFEPGVEEMIVE